MVDARPRDPVSAVREMLKWEASLRDVFASRFGRFAHGWSPDFEVRESHVAIRFIADVPGVRPDDLELRVDEGRLVITGRREPESRTDDEQLTTSERSFGQFMRTFTLPSYVELDHITSELRDGVLTIAVPKKRGASSRRIPINGATPKS
jgi:HSP20 family protein